MRRLGVLASLLVSISVAVATARQPNVLLIVSEDNGPELGCYGDPYVTTPTLDKLAAGGVRFEHAFVPQAGCSQSRAALLTGLFPHQNGQIGLATWKFHMYGREIPNLVRCLKQAGYRTGIIGKLHINPAAAFPFVFTAIPKSNFGRKQVEQYAKQAETFFSQDQRPFFLSVNYPDAHRPFLKQIDGLPAKPLTRDDVTPLAYFGLDSPKLREETANYYNCMNRLDSLVGDLLAALRRAGKSEDTLIIYMGDHGADLLRGKRTCYEGGLRVPLIVHWKGKIQPGQTRGELVSTLDIMPTLLDACEANNVPHLAGTSLLPLLRDESADWREHLFTEYHLHSAHNFYPQRAVRNARYKLIWNLLPGQVNPGYDFTLKRFFADLPERIDAADPIVRSAYQRMRRPPEFELYDLLRDPFEFQDLSQDAGHAAVLEQLKTRLSDWRVRTRDPLLSNDALHRLKAEVEACFENGEPNKSMLNLTYGEYFGGADSP